METVDGATPTTSSLLTIKHVAALLNVSPRQVQYLVAKGLLGSICFGRARRFTEQHITDFLAAHEVASATTDVPGQLELELGLRTAEPPPQTPAGTRLAA